MKTLNELIKFVEDNHPEIDLRSVKTELHDLNDESIQYGCLVAVGVDNWEGYDCARKMYRDVKDGSA